MKKITFFFLFLFCAPFLFAQKTNIVAGVSATYQGEKRTAYGYTSFTSERSTAFNLGYQLGKYMEFGGTIAVNVKKHNSLFDDKNNGSSHQKTVLHSVGAYLRGYCPLTKDIRFFVQPSASSRKGKETRDATRTYIDGYQEKKIDGTGFQIQPGIQFKVGHSLRIEVLISGSSYSKENSELTVSTNKNYPVGQKSNENTVLHDYSLSDLQLGVIWRF